MKEIKVNNNRALTLSNKNKSVEVVVTDGKGGIEYSYNIPDGDIVMLLNYWRNCKAGRENSDYIAEGKVVNTNIIGEIEYI